MRTVFRENDSNHIQRCSHSSGNAQITGSKIVHHTSKTSLRPIDPDYYNRDEQMSIMSRKNGTQIIDCLQWQLFLDISQGPDGSESNL
jgi:hypothetical protein